ncbi:MAG: acyl carrier protein [Clostridiales bacterium]|nr:acyl carrier protein [Clostridiales bacterium]
MVFEKVVNLIVGQLPVKAEDIKMESRLFEDLGADSANVMMLIMDLEAEFDITVEDEMLTGIRTVGDIVEYLEKNV